jgi:hypothetical protein
MRSKLHRGWTGLRQVAARFPSLWYDIAAVVLTNVALLIPCFWHSRIQAGDFSSHVYNAWLAEQIRARGLEGLVLVHPWTNFLFDELLSAMAYLAGYTWGQRFSAALVVLIFFWGAFRFTAALSRASAWPVAPLLAVLTYGWTFHAGFFNYLLGAGLSLWGAALLLWPTAKRIFGGIVLMGLGVASHALPVACAGAILAYVYISRRVTERGGILLFWMALACIVLARFLISSLFTTSWVSAQAISATGLDQVWVFGIGYLGLALVLLLAVLPVPLRSGGLRNTALQLWLLACAGVVLIPNRILFPGFAHDLGFISNRSSLIAGVLFLAVAAGVKLYWYESAALGAVAIVFFGMLYVDTGAFNRLEDRLEAAINVVPRGSRVVLGIYSEKLRVDPFGHMIDRACIGRCFSYANYEPTTQQFRVRAVTPNSYVVHDYRDSWAIQSEQYRVAVRDRPLFVAYADKVGLRVRKLEAGEVVPRTRLSGDSP